MYRVRASALCAAVALAAVAAAPALAKNMNPYSEDPCSERDASACTVQPTPAHHATPTVPGVRPLQPVPPPQPEARPWEHESN